MCQGGFLKKNEDEGWLLYEDLADKTIQWEPTPKKFRSNDPSFSKGGAHSIEANIATEAKLATVMRRLEALETKEPVSVNQVSPTPSTGCTYCQAMNHVFEECPVCLTHQILPEHMNAAFTRPANNPYAPSYNSGWRNHLNFSLSQNKQFPPSSHQPNFSNYQQTFSNQVPQGPHFEKNSTDFEKILASFMQNTRQAISRLEVQIS